MATTPKRLPNGRWRIQVYLGRHPESRKHQFKCITKDTLHEAQKEVRKYETRKDKGEQLTTDKHTLAQFLTEWLVLKERGAVMDRNGRKKRIGPRTLDDYRRLLTEWILQPKHPDLPRIGGVRLEHVRYQTLDTLYEAMAGVTATGTVRKLNALLGQVFHEVQKNEVLSRNPAEWTHVPQDDDDDGDDDASAQAMDQEQAARFLRMAREAADAEGDTLTAMPERCWSALFHILLGGGLRPGEAFALRWVDVHEIGRAAQVQHNLVRIRGVQGYELRKPKTKKSRRVVELPESAWKELMLWKKAQRVQQRVAGEVWQDLGFVFTTSKGTPLHGARRAFERTCVAAELGECGRDHVRTSCWCQDGKHGISGPLPAPEFTPAFRIYDLRHTYVTLQLMAGVPVNVVADGAGHEKASFTIARYGHALPKQQREATEKLESVLFATA